MGWWGAAVCSYLNHAAVYGQGSADHVDVGGGGGPLPLGQSATSGRVRRGVVEGMGRRVAMHSAGSGERENVSRDKAYTRLSNIFVFVPPPPPCCDITPEHGKPSKYCNELSASLHYTVCFF